VAEAIGQQRLVPLLDSYPGSVRAAFDGLSVASHCRRSTPS